jgi:ferredoxin
MPTIVFEPPLGESLRVESEGDEDLLDVCDEVVAPIVFSCRSTTCGTCAVRVTEGEDLLDPPGPREAQLMEALHTDGQRFACAMHVRSGNGLLRLRVCAREAFSQAPQSV